MTPQKHPKRREQHLEPACRAAHRERIDRGGQRQGYPRDRRPGRFPVHGLPRRRPGS